MREDLIERINARLALRAAPPEWADNPVYVDAEPVRTLLHEAAAALEAAREDGWRVADEPPDGAMGCWTEDVITVSNHGTVCTIGYFHDPADGVWQRPGRYVSGEEVVMWRPLPAIDQARGKGGAE